jgi:hypothetical protein
MTDLEEMALQALGSGVKWRLDGEPCWCDCERRAAWQAGTKIHSKFCREASVAYSRLLDEAVSNPPRVPAVIEAERRAFPL